MGKFRECCLGIRNERFFTPTVKFTRRKRGGFTLLDSYRALRKLSTYLVAAWRSGNIVGRINEVTLRRGRLVLGRLTVFGGQTTSVFHQATQANSASYSQRDEKRVPATVR